MTIFWCWLFFGADYFLVLTIFWWWLSCWWWLFHSRIGERSRSGQMRPILQCNSLPLSTIGTHFSKIFRRPWRNWKLFINFSKKQVKWTKNFQLYVWSKFPGKSLYLSPSLVFTLVLPQAMNEMRLQKHFPIFFIGSHSPNIRIPLI